MARKPSKLDQALALENPPTETGTEIAAFTPDNPLVVFQSQEQFDELLGKIRATVAAHVPDVSTAKGRDEIKRLAFKVVKTRTALDAAGKSLNESKRDEINAVDAQRREIRSQLEALEAEARKPLDEWETAENSRLLHISTTTETIATLEADIHGDSASIGRAIESLQALELDADIFQDQLADAVAAKQRALGNMSSALERAIQAEADAAELARLRATEHEREAQEFARAEEARLAAETKDAEEAAESARQQAEQKRLDDIRAAEERAAEDARQAAAREAQAKIDAANAEAARLKKIEDDRIAAEKKAADEQAARDADRAHRSKIMKAAKEAIMALGVNEPDAKAVVLAIVAGEIPNVRLTF